MHAISMQARTPAPRRFACEEQTATAALSMLTHRHLVTLGPVQACCRASAKSMPCTEEVWTKGCVSQIRTRTWSAFSTTKRARSASCCATCLASTAFVNCSHRKAQQTGQHRSTPPWASIQVMNLAAWQVPV